jgi:uncharacterized protein YjiS (DUF1127 family)
MVAPRVPVPDLLRPSSQPGRRHAASLKLWSEAAAAVASRSLRIADRLLFWLERYRQRRALRTLSDHMLKDLGLSRSDSGRETGKRFWED